MKNYHDLYLKCDKLYWWECSISVRIPFWLHWNKYGNNSRLLLIGTDSLMYEIKIEDVYKNFSNDKEKFNFSNYSTKSKYYDNSNKLVVGKMKNEATGATIEEFLRLRL